MNGLESWAHDLLRTWMLCTSLGSWVTVTDSRLLCKQGSLNFKLYVLPIFSAAWEWKHLIKHLFSDMIDFLETVGHNALTVPPTAYLIWKKLLPEKAPQEHLMNKAVSVTDCDICFNMLWERFSDQWALTFEEGKTNVTCVFPSWLWPTRHGKVERCCILLALGSNKLFFPTHRPRLLFSFRDLMLKMFENFSCSIMCAWCPCCLHVRVCTCMFMFKCVCACVCMYVHTCISYSSLEFVSSCFEEKHMDKQKSLKGQFLKHSINTYITASTYGFISLCK